MTKRISELPAAGTVADTDEFELNQSGVSRRATRGQVIAGLASAAHQHDVADITDAGALAALDVVGTAEIAPTAYASQADAVTGTDNAKVMTALRTAQAIAAQAIAPAHQHSLADITDAGALAALDAIRPTEIDPSAYATQIDAAEGVDGTRIMTAERTAEAIQAQAAPLIHQHSIVDIADVGALAALDTVGAGEIGPNAVTSGKILALAVTTAKLANAAVTEEKISPTVYASHAEATAGTDNTKLMTPLRTAAAIAARPPSAHQHVLADITDAGTLAGLDTVGTGQITNDAVTLPKISFGINILDAGPSVHWDCTNLTTRVILDQNIAAFTANNIKDGARYTLEVTKNGVEDWTITTSTGFRNAGLLPVRPDPDAVTIFSFVGIGGSLVEVQGSAAAYNVPDSLETAAADNEVVRGDDPRLYDGLNEVPGVLVAEKVEWKDLTVVEVTGTTDTPDAAGTYRTYSNPNGCEITLGTDIPDGGEILFKKLPGAGPITVTLETGFTFQSGTPTGMAGLGGVKRIETEFHSLGGDWVRNKTIHTGSGGLTIAGGGLTAGGNINAAGHELLGAISPFQTMTGSQSGAPSGRSWKIVGNATNIPVTNGWWAKVVNRSGSSKTLTPISGSCILTTSGTTQATATLGNDKSCLIHGDGTNLIVEGGVS